VAVVRKAFPHDTLPIWSDYDYSDPRTTQVGHAVEGDQVSVLRRKFPGVFIQWVDGRTGWMCEWAVEMDPKEVKTIPWIDAKNSPQKIIVNDGDVYQFVVPVSIRAGVNYLTGDLLLVQKFTKETPYGELGPNGINWVCTTRFNTSVWSTLESCIERGMLKKIHHCY
jgi:hypothetical protein